MVHTGIQVLSAHLRQRRDAVWENVDICPRTCPTRDSRMRTFKNWFARPADRNARSFLDLPLSVRCMHRFLRFRMGCHKLTRDTECLPGVPRQDRICMMCQQGVLGDEKHLVFECPALQDLRNRNKNLFKVPHGDAMIMFMWQDDTIGVARFIDACLEIHQLALPWRTRHLISPRLSGKDVMILLLLQSHKCRNITRVANR